MKLPFLGRRSFRFERGHILALFDQLGLEIGDGVIDFLLEQLLGKRDSAVDLDYLGVMFEIALGESERRPVAASRSVGRGGGNGPVGGDITDLQKVAVPLAKIIDLMGEVFQVDQLQPRPGQAAAHRLQPLRHQVEAYLSSETSLLSLMYFCSRTVHIPCAIARPVR